MFHAIRFRFAQVPNMTSRAKVPPVTALAVAAATLLGACSSIPPAATASPAPAPAATPTQTPSPSPASTPFAIKDGEQWIAYLWLQECDADGCDKHGVYLVRPDGRDRHLLLTHPAGHVDWSPDGKRIVIETEPPETSEFWILDADGTNAQVVTCDGAPCFVGSAAWSPDGGHLALQRGFPRKAGETYDRVAIEVVDLVTGATRVVAVSPVAGTEYIEYNGPRWSPDGTQIVFTVMRYPVPPTDENILGSSIAVVKADGSDADAPRVLTDPALFANYADWSPDGERIVFSTYPLGSFGQTTKATNLYTIRPDATDLTQVTFFGENDTRATQPTWTPDGQRIIFTEIVRNPANPRGEHVIALINADGSDLTLIPTPITVGDPYVPGVWYGNHARMRPTP